MRFLPLPFWSPPVIAIFLTMIATAGALNATPSTRPAIEEANRCFEEAKRLFTEDRAGNNADIKRLLIKARTLYTSVGALTPEEEDKLTKINGMRYWQNKFSTVDDSKNNKRELKRKLAPPPPVVIPDEPKPVAPPNEPNNGDLTPDSAPAIAQTTPVGKEELVVTKSPEAVPAATPVAATSQGDLVSEAKFRDELDRITKDSGDAYSKMLACLDLQVMAPNAELGKMALERVRALHQEMEKQAAEIRSKALTKVRNYDRLLRNKQYADLAKNLDTLLKTGDLTPPEKQLISQLHKETVVMREIMAELQTGQLEEALPVPKQCDFGSPNAVVIKIDAEKIYFKDGANQEISVGLDSVQEDALLALAASAIKSKEGDVKNHMILAVANLRIGEYAKSFEHFSWLVAKDPAGLMTYRPFLDRCEVNFRLKNGPHIDDKIAEALAVAGTDRKKARVMLERLIDEYFGSPLAAAYIARLRNAMDQVMKV